MATPIRAHDWVERLHRSTMQWKDEPFAWGVHDCATAVSKHIKAMTGIDVGRGICGTYSSPETAAAAIRKLTGKGETLEDAVVHICGAHDFAEIPVKMAHRGDVVLFDTPWGQAIGVVHLNGIDAAVTGPEGLRRLRTLHARRAWRIPYVLSSK